MIVWVDQLKLWWPAVESQPLIGHGSVAGRITDLDITVGLCKQRRTCVQAGAHVGLWPARLARSFKRVLSFEVMPACFKAARENTRALPNVTVSPLGLGARKGERLPLLATSVGSWRIDPAGREQADMTTIDSLELTDCDAIILDIEGYEVEALTGAAETIRRCRPVIHVEELPRSKVAIQTHLAALGYREHRRVHADAIYVPR